MAVSTASDVREPADRPALLVLRALGLGDLCTVVPALRALAAHYREHRIVLAAPEELADLMPLIGVVDELLPTPGLRTPRWRGRPPDIAANLHGRGPQSIDALRDLRPRRLLSFAHPERPDHNGPAWWPEEHEVERWCRMVCWYGVPADPTDLALRAPRAPNPAPGAVVVHPGAAYAARRWPAERFGAVARSLARLGERIVITGTAAERGLARRVARAAGLGEAAVLAGRTTLGELASLVAAARLVVSNDTGVAHVATAYRTPAVTLFGPTPPQAWGPLTGSDNHAALWTGGRGDPHANVPDEGLLDITPNDVVDAARRVLARCGGLEDVAMARGRS